MSKVILICGKICCGKTTYAEQLREKGPAVQLSVDEIMLTLFGQHAGDRHDEYAQKTQAYLFRKSLDILETGVDVILDWGFWTKQGRADAKAFYAARKIKCELHYLNVSDSVWKERLNRRNALVQAGQTEAYYVDRNLADKFASRFEEPTEEEIDLRISA